MAHRDDFWKLEHLSDAQLLESLNGVLRTQRRALAALLAHLAEVEERRLHLVAACSSMFAYCVGRLGMSEDEACRRIDLARLARTFPALFAELESGQLTLSTALVLKPVLTLDNHRELLCAARGKSTQQVRELLAARFPKDDVPSSIRKLPERRPLGAGESDRENAVSHLSSAAKLSSTCEPSSAADLPTRDLSSAAKLSSTCEPSSAADLPTRDLSSAAKLSSTCEPSSAADLPTAFPSPQMPAPVPTRLSAPSDTFHLSPGIEGRPLPAPRAGSVPASRGIIEPLSAERYRIQFTADAELKRKLELARDLLRHAHPSGDFAPIVARALDLLIDDVQRRRFGVDAGGKRAGTAAKAAGSPKGARRARAGEPPLPNPAQARSAASGVDTHRKRSSPTARGDSPPGSDASARADASASPNASPPSAPSDASAPSNVASSPNGSQPPCPASNAAARSDASAPPNPGPCAAKRRRSHIPRAARRAVLERDGLGCSWVDAHGVRCGSRAWLELDHRQPSGKGGSSEPDNVRLLCRAHNHFAAERAYGREHIERASSRVRESRAQQQEGQSSTERP